MKRSMGTSTPIRMFGPKSGNNSTTTQMKRLKRDGSCPKHLRRGASHASSAQEYMKSEWTCDELDLSKQIPPLTDFVPDKFKLTEELFSIFSILELKEFTPDILKEYSINQLKELCLEQLNSISTSKIKFILEGNDPEDYFEPEIEIEDKAIGDTTDGIQLSVDDNEYSDFLGSENLEQKKPKTVMVDAEVQANWSSLESSSDDESHSDNRDGEGWMNLWKLEQMEILELEMRARAIRMLLKQQEEEESAHKSTEDNKQTECTNNTKDVSNDNILTEESKADTKVRTDLKNITEDGNCDQSDLEEGERPDSGDDSNDNICETDNQNKDTTVTTNSEVESANEESVVDNESSDKQKLNEENIESNNEDTNRVSDVENKFNTEEKQLKDNQQNESDSVAENKPEEEEEKEVNETVEELSIKINEEFDEELMEENSEEDEEEVNEETTDNQSVISESDA